MGNVMLTNKAFRKIAPTLRRALQPHIRRAEQMEELAERAVRALEANARAEDQIRELAKRAGWDGKGDWLLAVMAILGKAYPWCSPAEFVKLNTYQVAGYLLRLVPRKRGGRKLSPDTLRRNIAICEEANRGVTERQLVKKYGIPKSTVHRIRDKGAAFWRG
jgi:hypothetical protein